MRARYIIPLPQPPRQTQDRLLSQGEGELRTKLVGFAVLLTIGIWLWLMPTMAVGQTVLELAVPDAGSASHENKASELVRLKPGYSFKPDAGSGNVMHAFIDPSIINETAYTNLNGSGGNEPWPPQIDPSKAVGFTPGSHSVTPTGAAAYDIPIQLPPGTAGIAPSLSISYNSQSGNGLLGMGWNISGLSAITRVPNTIYHTGEVKGVQLDVTDVYALDGNRLIPIGTEDCDYAAEHETFACINTFGNIGNNGPEWFEVKTKEGMTMEYGRESEVNESQFTTSHTNLNERAVIVYRINKMYDPYGNYITFKYRNINRQSVIEEIRYTGNENANIQPYNIIQFEYDEREDKNTIFINGQYSDVKSNLLLRKIRIIADGQHFKNYVFEYVFNLYSLLKSVTESGTNGEELNSTVMRYGDDVSAVQAVESNILTSANTEVIDSTYFLRDRIFSGDFNGDGYTDIMTAVSLSYLFFPSYSYLYNFKVRINSHESQFDSPIPISNSEIGCFWDFDWEDTDWLERNVHIADFNGDGKDDILIACLDNITEESGEPTGSKQILSIKIWSLSNSGFELIHDMPQSFFGSHTILEQPLQFGDFNGDGVTDILTLLGGPILSYPYYLTKAQMLLSRIDGSGFDYLPIPAFDNYDPQSNPEIPTNINHISVLDYNGNGLSDLMITADNETNIYEFIRIGNLMVDQNLYDGNFPNNLYSNIKYGDFNGDGKTDILGRHAAGVWRIGLSQGRDGFAYAAFSFNDNVDVVGNDADYVQVADFDGDGRSDIIHESSNWGQQVIGLYSQIRIHSELGSTSYNYTNPSYFNVYGQQFILGDFNADGNCDLFSNEWGPSDGGNLYMFNADDKHHLLHGVSNGLGVDIAFDYGWISHGATYGLSNTIYPFPVQTITAPIEVITSMSEPNGIGAYHQTNFKYWDAIGHRHGKGFLGFSTIVRETIGLNRRKVDQFTLDEGSMTNQLSRSVISQMNGELVSTSVYDNEVVSIGSNRFWTRANSINTIDHAFGFNSTVTNVYDSNGDGNIIQTTEQNAVEKTITNYSQWVNAGSFRPNKPQRIDITKERTFGSEAAITRTTTFSYDLTTGGLLSSTKDPGDHSLLTTYAYDDFGNVTDKNQTIIGQNSRLTSFQFDQKGRFPIVKTNAIGLSEHYEYDGRWGKVTKFTSYDNLITTSVYDEFGNLASSTGPTGVTTVINRNWDIDQNTNTVYSMTTVSPSTPSATVGFDVFARELKISSEGYNQEILVKRKFDTKGRLDFAIAEHTEGGVEQPITSVCQYDDFNRLASVSDGVRSTTITYSPPAPGWTTKTTTDPSGERQEIVDEAGRIIHTEDDGGDLDFRYNSHGLPRQIIDADGNTLVSMEYNAVGRQTKLIDIDGGITDYIYNAFDELVYQKDALGNETIIEYDRLGRVVSKDNSSEGETNYEYVTSGNGLSKLKKVSSPNGSSRELEYDSQGRVSKEKTVIDQEVFEYSLTYDPSGNIASRKYPSGYTIHYEYDSNGFLTSLKEVQSSTELFSLQSKNAKGQVTEYGLGNGDNVVRTFDDYGLPITETSDVLHREYEFDAVTGNLGSRKDTERLLQEGFQYDELHRLEESEVMFDNGGGFTYLYYPIHVDYSDNGNIEFKTDAGVYAYDASRIHAVRSITNSDENISLVTQDLTYTASDRTASIVEGLNEIQFTYGPDGDRLKSVLTVSEDDGNGGTQLIRTETRYYAGSYEKLIIEEDGEIQVYELHYVESPAGLTAIHVKQNGGQAHTFYVYKDYLGSITELTDEGGEIVLEQNFDAWGRSRNPDNWTYDLDSYILPPVPSNIPDPSVWLNRGYTGHEHLDEFALINMNNRMYDPTIGRMLAVDNYIADSYSTQAFNRYSYVLNNPLKFVDPTGEYGINPPSSFSYSYNFSSYPTSTGYSANFSLSYSYSMGNNLSGSGSVNVSMSFNTVTGIFSGNVCVDGNVVSSTLGASAFSRSGGWSYTSSDYLRAANWRQNSIDYNYAQENISHVLSPVQSDNFPGISVYQSPLMDGKGVTMPPFGIIVGTDAGEDLIQHEYGHYLQYQDMGIVNYYNDVGLPSIYNEMENTLEKALFGKFLFSIDHRNFRTETDANIRSREFFGPGAPVQSWRTQTLHPAFTWEQRIQGIIFEAMCPSCVIINNNP